MRHTCFTQKRNSSGSLKCRDCGWNKSDAATVPEEMPALAKVHVEETGHTVVRILKTETFYGPFEGELLPEPEPKIGPRAFCKGCNKFIAEKAKNIYVYWGASSHRKKSGHEVVIIMPDGTERIPK